MIRADRCRASARQLRFSFPALQRGNAVRDALRRTIIELFVQTDAELQHDS
ncbi:DUF1534 domain-containing protein [Pseudomonas caricapapayae]|nr:DUF1534 domain-containing protein [Pseudomonas caricapapayae]